MVNEARTLNFLPLSALFYRHCSVSTALKLLTHAERGKDQVKNKILAFFHSTHFLSQVDESASVSVFRRKKKSDPKLFAADEEKKVDLHFLTIRLVLQKKYRSASLSENQFSLFFAIVER